MLLVELALAQEWASLLAQLGKLEVSRSTVVAVQPVLVVLVVAVCGVAVAAAEVEEDALGDLVELLQERDQVGPRVQPGEPPASWRP